MSEVPLSRTEIAHDLYDRDAKRSVGVHDGDRELNVRDLPVKVSSHESLPQQLDRKSVV